MAETLKPGSVSDVCDMIAGRAAIEVRGGGSKAEIGFPRETRIMEMSAFRGVIDYDPPELVLTVGAGARLADVEALVSAEGQMLAFEPFDHGPLLGKPSGAATIGGVVAAGVAGSRRLSAGGARDHLLGFEAVSGRGERFVGGAKVVKNVTGYDLPKLMAGSWGRLAVLTQVTLKVLPAPRVRTTVALRGLGDREAVRAMAAAMGSPAEVGAAAHLPDAGVTALRVEGFGPSVTARAEMLRRLLGGGDLIEGAESDALWASVRDAAPLAEGDVLWRVSVAPSAGPAIHEALAPLGARRLYDWAGGLVWLALPAEADQTLVRAATDAAGGHAMLVRAPEALRRRIPALHPEAAGVAALSRRVKTAFDPAGVLDPKRFSDAD